MDKGIDCCLPVVFRFKVGLFPAHFTFLMNKLSAKILKLHPWTTMVLLCWALKVCGLVMGMLYTVSCIVGDHQEVRCLVFLCFTFSFFFICRGHLFCIYFVVKTSLNVNEILHELLIGMIYVYNN